MIFHVVLALAVACFLLGATLSRVYVGDGRLAVLILALAVYTAGNVLMVRLMRESGLAIAVSLTTILQLLLINAVAFAFFGERPAPQQMLGLGLGVVAVGLIVLPAAGR